MMAMTLMNNDEQSKLLFVFIDLLSFVFIVISVMFLAMLAKTSPLCLSSSRRQRNRKQEWQFDGTTVDYRESMSNE